MTSKGKVTVLGINGHIGNAAAAAFAEAGWEVTGFGRSNRKPLPGVRFLQGDADRTEDLARAVANAEVVVNALNLPYDRWGNGAMERQTERVLQAFGRSGKTLLFPGNIYNFAADARRIGPEHPQQPATPRGAIRVRTEGLIRAAAERGDIQAIVIRAGDFFAPGLKDDWFAQAILREAGKGRVATMGAPEIGHSWAYLPDLGRAFEQVAAARVRLPHFLNTHFAGHYVTHRELTAAIQAAAPVPLKAVPLNWTMLSLVGLAMPVLREVVKMRYLWDGSMQLVDPALEELLGPDFGTPFEEALAAVLAPFFPALRQAA